MRKVTKAAGTAAILLATSLSLSACAPSNTFNPGEPAVLPANAIFPDIAADSVRDLGEDQSGNEFFYARTSDPTEQVCLVVVPKTADAFRGCSDAPPVTAEAGDLRATLHEEPVSDHERDHSVGEYITLEESTLNR